MKKIFITGSTDGLGFMAAERLIKMGHNIILHARNEEKAQRVFQKLPEAFSVVVGDLSSMAQTQEIAKQVNALGVMNSIIHNAGLGFQESHKLTEDGLPHIFAINSLAPYMLTCLVHKPKRLIYTSSGMHEVGDTTLTDLLWKTKRWNASQAYSDTKLQNVLLTFAVARYYPEIYSNVVSPGWVATKMGGAHAPDDLGKAPETQVWLASSDAKEVQVSGQFLYHKKPKHYLKEASDPILQDKFINFCKSLSGLEL